MPRGLAIETSGRNGLVALVENGKVLLEDRFPHGLRHAAEMIPRIDRMCQSLSLRPADLREVFVSIGPGSFTGLRIGVTVAKTLAFATGAKLVAVPSVEVLVRNVPPGWQNAIIVLDAKRDQIFTARFANEAGRFVEVEPAHLDSLSEMLVRCSRPVHLIGEGIPFHQKFVPPDPNVHVSAPEQWNARAEVLAELGHAMAVAGRFTLPDQLTPLYVRRPEAEEKYEERKTRGSGK